MDLAQHNKLYVFLENFFNNEDEFKKLFEEKLITSSILTTTINIQTIDTFKLHSMLKSTSDMNVLRYAIGVILNRDSLHGLWYKAEIYTSRNNEDFSINFYHRTLLSSIFSNPNLPDEFIFIDKGYNRHLLTKLILHKNIKNDTLKFFIENDADVDKKYVFTHQSLPSNVIESIYIDEGMDIEGFCSNIILMKEMHKHLNTPVYITKALSGSIKKTTNSHNNSTTYDSYIKRAILGTEAHCIYSVLRGFTLAISLGFLLFFLFQISDYDENFIKDLISEDTYTQKNPENPLPKETIHQLTKNN